MLLSLSLIFLIGFALKGICQKLRLPGLLGLLLAGVLLGPQILNLIDGNLQSISADLRRIALIVILVRAGLSIDLKDLRQAGRPALLLCFLPAGLEIAGVLLLAPPLLHISRLEAAMLGAILAAVSPAITVPKMIHLHEAGYGRQRHIPQIVMAGASVDNIFNIALFTALLGIYTSQSFSPLALIKIPLGLVSGLLVGLGLGRGLVILFRRIHMRDTVKVLIILGLALGLAGSEALVTPIVPFSGLLAVMALGVAILRFYEPLAKRIAGKFNQVWVAAELILFVLLGAIVDLRAVASAGLAVVLLVLAALACRSAGVLLSLAGTGIPWPEKVFCIIAYWPKATVQAAIGALPLAAGVPAGGLILAAAVIAVLVTAPLGAVGMELAAPRLLSRPHPPETAG